MKLSRTQQKLLRWYAAGHSVQMVAQYCDMDTREAGKMLKELEVEDKHEAAALLAGSKDDEQLEQSNDNLPNAGELVPEFKPDMVDTKLADYDKREIAARGGNDIDVIPMALEQTFRMDVRWRPLSIVKDKYMSYAKTEEILEATILKLSPASHKRLYGDS